MLVAADLHLDGPPTAVHHSLGTLGGHVRFEGERLDRYGSAVAADRARDAVVG